jgi:hypothetical protein
MPRRAIAIAMPITFYPAARDALLTVRVKDRLARDTPLIAERVIKVLLAHGFNPAEYAVLIADVRTAAIVKDRLVRDVLPQ